MDGHVLAEDTWPPLSLRRLEVTSRLVSAAGCLRLKTTGPTDIVDLTLNRPGFSREPVM